MIEPETARVAVPPAEAVAPEAGLAPLAPDASLALAEPRTADPAALRDLLRLADIYAGATGSSEGTVSDRVLHGGNRLAELRAGRSDIGVRRIAKAVVWFSDNWPDRTAWPAGIARPPRTPIPEPAISGADR